ncbi:FHA domain-containing protein [Actinomadura rupiterrae]|uniref:FHA domain-containing protein n=1 Tax=Actinomadura rupiterrae TaxID=559627 RepID=UPI0020A28076|nr:FHA domain-containing protein [Actinomadura rupiterrae]MCP2334699.1 hypothetical protein [Actinomadura rupiterrae]
MDLEGFTRNAAVRQPNLSEAVPRVLETAMRRSGLSWEDRRFPQSTGDGYILGLPVESVPLVLHPFLGELQAVLEEETRALRALDPALRLRMRVSVHLGPLPYTGGESPSDGIGKPLNDACRLLDSDPPRKALLLTDPEVTRVAAVISSRVHEDVVEAGFTALRPSELIPVHAQVKQFSEDAWLFIPAPSGVLLSQGFPDARTGAEQDAPSATGLPGRPMGPETGDERSLPVPARELNSIRTRYVAPPGAARLYDLLRTRHLAVVEAEPGGRRTTALHQLDKLSLETGITIRDVVKRWSRPSVGDLPLATGCGYLLDLNAPATDSPDESFAEDLETHAERLVDHGSYLVITARPELWRDCRALAGPLTVALGLPDPDAVADAHFHALLSERAGTGAPASQAADRRPRLRAVPPFTLPPGTRPSEAVAAAERFVAGRSVPAPDASSRAVFLRVRTPEDGVSEIVLTGNRIRRDEIRVGRPFPGMAPDIAVDCDLVHRDHCRLTRHAGRWSLEPRGRNLPLIRRRGQDEPEPVAAPTWLENGDEVLIRVRPGDGRAGAGRAGAGRADRFWVLEFHDPQRTAETGPAGEEAESAYEGIEPACEETRPACEETEPACEEESR